MEFERRFATDVDRRAKLIEARWRGVPACAWCNCSQIWTEHGGFLFECAECGHHTSLTASTLLEKSAPPFASSYQTLLTRNLARSRRSTISSAMIVSAKVR